MTNFSNFTPPTARISSVIFKVLTDQQAEQLSMSNIVNTKTQAGERGGLFDPHLGSLSDSTPCFSCYNTKKHCQGHSGILPLKHAYIIPHFEPYVKTVLRKLCLNCYRIIGSGKKCPSCKIPAPIIKDSKSMRITIVHNGKKLILDPKQLKNILNNIDLETAVRDLNIGISPADLISNNLFISSPVIRPDKRIQSQYKNNDEFTVNLSAIIQSGIRLNLMNENTAMFQKIYETMCQQLISYHKGETGGDDDANKGGQNKSISGSMMTKEGRVRGNVLGKKVSQMGRAVIACDASNPPDVVTIPLEFAMSVFAKEVVRDFNRDRLQKVFNNGPKQYPGATYIVKNDGKRYQIGNINVQMEEGDVIFRHLQTGDYALFNRQPSLLPTSICTHKIRVQTQPGTDTMDFNVIACPLYNADFDGDEMSIIVITNQTSLAEAQYVSTVHNRIISQENNRLAIQQWQDSVIGGYVMTKDQYSFDQMFIIRIQQNTRIKIDLRKFGTVISGKQLLSLVLPQLNYTGKPSFYVPEYEDFIKYKPTDKQLKIELGEIKQGYFDNSASHFQKQIALTNDPKTALDYIFSIQQTILNFNKYHGFSIGIKDFHIPEINRELIQQKKDLLMQQGYQITINYAKNNFIMNPIEQTKYQYLLDTLSKSYFDDCMQELMKIPVIDGNEVRNNLYNLAISGTKGKFTNLKSMFVFIGFVLLDNEPLKQNFQGRMNMFFKRFDLDPRSFGVVLNSYISGLTPCDILLNSVPERIQMLQKVLTVAKAGSMGRKLIKNYESLIVHNTRFVRKQFAITQILFGYDGFQVQTLSKYKIPNVFDSEEVFIQKLMDGIRMEQAKDKCLEHVKYVSTLVQKYKIIMISNQRVNDQYTFTDEIFVPIVIDSLLSTRIQQLKIKKPTEQQMLDNSKKLRQFIDDLGYIYFNHNMRQQRKYIPDLYDNAIFCVKLALATCFTLDRLALFNTNQLDLILADITLSLQQNLVEYGTPIGINTAQCYQEFLTQALLDSIHKTGTGRVRKSGADRLSELFTNKTPQTQKTPPIIKIPLTYETSKERAEFIANRIKLIQFNSLIDSWIVLFTDLENIDNPSYKNHQDMEFVQKTQLPDSVTKWCIRVELDKMKLFINSISMQEIKESILNQFDVFIASNTEDNSKPVLRIYLGQCLTFESRPQLKEIVHKILNSTVRGLDTIVSANAIQQKMIVMNSQTKKLEQKTKFCIVAEGSNLEELFNLQNTYGNDIQFENITCDNVVVTYQWFGRMAAMVKLVNEIKSASKDAVDVRHIYLLADEMIQTGKLTSVETEGIKQRNPTNDLLQISESRPVTTIRKAALQNKRSYVESLSANMMMGQTPDIGTHFNSVLINEQIVLQQQQNQTDFQSLISEFN